MVAAEASTEAKRGAGRRVAPHPTPEERAARGRAARADVPRSSHADWAPAADRRDPGRAARGAGRDARAGAGPDPLRAHARLAVHVLPRRRVPDGRRPRAGAAHGLHAQLCGDAHLSNFGAFAAPDRRLVFEPQRLRRDAARAVRVGSQAPRRELRRRRARPRLQRAGAPHRQPAPWRAYREAMHGVRAHAQPGRLVRAPRRGRDLRPLPQAGEPQGARALRGEHRQGPGQGQPQGVRQAHARSSTASGGSSATRR